MSALRRTASALVTCLVLAACAEAGTPDDAGQTAPGATARTGPPDPAADPSPTGLGPRTRIERAPHPVSLPALAQQRYDGGGLRLRQVTLRTDAYTQYAVTYRSGGLTISGLLNVPSGRGPFPALVLAHGYIDPAYYVTGQGLTRERDWLARAGYVTLHTDYRNHATSDDDPASDLTLRLGYTEDVVNAVRALRRGPRFVDDDRLGLLGRSMGGGVVYNAMVVRPGLVDAAVAFAPVSSDAVDNFERWIRPDPSRSGLSRRVIARYGAPEDRPGFWRRVSPRTYFDRVTEPLQVHHGTSDDSCPLLWTRATVRALERAGKPVDLHVYPGEEHAFGPQWELSMRRTAAFLDRHLT